MITVEEGNVELPQLPELPDAPLAPEAPSAVGESTQTEDIADTTDEQIEKLLKEVEVLKQKSPVKFPTQQEQEQAQSKSEDSTPDSTVLSEQPDSSSDSLGPSPSPPPATIINTSDKDSQGQTIPKSVSQALFSNALKVTRVRDKSSAPKYIGKPVIDQAAAEKISRLEQRDYELARKTHKLQREIDYLKSLIDTASVSSNLSELRKLRYAIERLENYLDQKQKEKYEVGIQLTRAVRKRVDSGESGKFWSKAD